MGGAVMNEIRGAMKRMAFYYFLLALNILPSAGVIPDVFPFRNFSVVYLLFLAVCLVLYYDHRVSPTGTLSVMMKLLSWAALFLILLRGVKYSAVSEVGVLARHAWYLYYVPMLLLPLFLFYISFLVSPGKSARRTFILVAASAVTAAFIILVLTNDLHQLVFRFQPGFLNWDGDYTRGWLFYAVTVWQYLLYFSAIVILAVRCRVTGAKKGTLIIMIPFSVGIAMNVLLMTGKMPKINGNIIEFPEALIFTAAIVLECCMQLGLIPTNANYGKLFGIFSISAQITDREGTPVYRSASAMKLTAEQIALPDGSRAGEHTVLHKMKIPGGFGFWQDDLTELDRLNEELAEAGEGLAQEAELSRLRNELKEKQTKIEQRTLVYDMIAKRTQRQSQLISLLCEEAKRSQGPVLRDENRRWITLFGAYIKRYANLTLLSQQSPVIEAGELGLSVLEVLRCLNYCGVPGELLNNADVAVKADAALAAFETFGTLLEENRTRLLGVLVNLSGQGPVTFKITLEGVEKTLPASAVDELASYGIASESTIEDGVTYVVLNLPEGGESA